MKYRFGTRYPTLLAVLALAACGGGGGGSDDGPSPSTFTVSGVAATGEAFAGADVEVKCASGTAEADVTTDDNGRYEVTVTSGTLPCVIRVSADGEALHSIVPSGADLPATANVTPLTELLVAAISGGPAEDLFDTFDATAQADLTEANVATATDDVVDSLAGIVDLGGDDLLGGDLVAAVGGEGGNLLDQKLDAIERALEETDTTLEELATAVVAAPGTPPAALADVPTAAASCPALRSGPYWDAEPINPEFDVGDGPITLDAANLEFNFVEDGVPVSVPLTPVAGQPCRFTLPFDAGTTEELVVSRSGIGATRFPEDGAFKGVILFPASPVTLAELEGDWNIVGSYTESGVVVPFNGRFTLSATGAATNRAFGVGPGEPAADVDRQLVANEDGSFSQLEGGVPINDRIKATRAPNGVITLFFTNIEGDGLPGIGVARRQTSVATPTVGDISRFWNFQYRVSGGAGNVTAITDEQVTITAVDAGATPRTETRIRASDSRVDTRSLDAPRSGLVYRALNACAVSGVASNCPSAITLAGQGTGFSVAAVQAGSAANNAFDISVAKP